MSESTAIHTTPRSRSGNLRRLTPSELRQLDRLREQFADKSSVDEIVTEQALDMASSPEPAPCPSWCDYAEGHTFDSADGPVATRTEVIRFHEQGFGDHVMVCQQETASVTDGTVTLGVPYVLVSADGLELTPVEADRLASSAQQAAVLLREVSA